MNEYKNVKISLAEVDRMKNSLTALVFWLSSQRFYMISETPLGHTVRQTIGGPFMELV